MRRLTVIQPGMLTTVQDLGRPGHTPTGVGRSGACDTISLRVGNRIVGNPDAGAAIEMTMVGATLRFECAADAVLAGASAPGAHVERSGGREPVRAWEPFAALAGDVLSVGALTGGARVYLCVAGAVASAPTLGSRSVHVSSGIGGRPLAPGDPIDLGDAAREKSRTLRPEAAANVSAHLARRVVRAIPVDGADRALFVHAYTVGVRSDRAGLRLEGPALRSPAGGRVLTEGIPPGAIQVPANGLPIALLADRPTTGGYPLGACVASVDLPVMGQLRPRDEVRFSPENADAARRALNALERTLDAAIAPAGAA